MTAYSPQQAEQESAKGQTQKADKQSIHQAIATHLRPFLELRDHGLHIFMVDRLRHFMSFIGEQRQGIVDLCIEQNVKMLWYNADMCHRIYMRWNAPGLKQGRAGDEVRVISGFQNQFHAAMYSSCN
jgi:hypothetical protein